MLSVIVLSRLCRRPAAGAGEEEEPGGGAGRKTRRKSREEDPEEGALRKGLEEGAQVTGFTAATRTDVRINRKRLFLGQIDSIYQYKRLLL